jgi:hypothetical protein
MGALAKSDSASGSVSLVCDLQFGQEICGSRGILLCENFAKHAKSSRWCKPFNRCGAIAVLIMPAVWS